MQMFTYFRNVLQKRGRNYQKSKIKHVQCFYCFDSSLPNLEKKIRTPMQLNH